MGGSMYGGLVGGNNMSPLITATLAGNSQLFSGQNKYASMLMGPSRYVADANIASNPLLLNYFINSGSNNLNTMFGSNNDNLLATYMAAGGQQFGNDNYLYSLALNNNMGGFTGSTRSDSVGLYLQMLNGNNGMFGL